MLKKLLPYEHDLFFLINGTRNHFLDNVLWLFSNGRIWAPLIAFFLFFLIYKKDWKQWLPLIIAITLMFVCCDQFSSGFCKHYFSRLRPTHHPDYIDQVKTLYGYRGGLYGFMSGHATNAFGFATFTSLLFRKPYYSAVIFVWALILIYSRVYLGVHFISDVVAGALSGALIGFLIYRLYQWYLKRRNVITPPFYAANWVKPFTFAIACYMLILMICNAWIILWVK